MTNVNKDSIENILQYIANIEKRLEKIGREITDMRTFLKGLEIIIKEEIKSDEQ